MPLLELALGQAQQVLLEAVPLLLFFFSSRRRHTRSTRDWSSDVCSSDLWDAGNSAFAISGGSPGTPPHTPGHGCRFPGMLFSPVTFQGQVSHQIQRHLLSIPARCAGDTTVRLMAHTV